MATTSTVTNPYKYAITEDIEITPIFSPKVFSYNDSTSYTYISLSGNTTKTVTHGTFTITAPETGYYHLYSQIRGGQTGQGYSGDKWQYANWYLDLDGTNFVTKTYRRSQGMGWKTIYDGEIYLTKGTHTLRCRILGKCSSKDSHQTYCYEWLNDLSIVI